MEIESVSLGMDHGGLPLRKQILQFLGGKCHCIRDHGAFDEAPVDYADFAQSVANDVLNGRADRGILICRSGIGMSIAVNRFRGIRGALVWNRESAELSCRHNHANVLCLGSQWLTEFLLGEILETFFTTSWELGRHCRRVEKCDSLERKLSCHN